MEAFAILHTIRRSSGEGEIYMNKKEFTMACAKCFSGFGFEKVKRSYAKKVWKYCNYNRTCEVELR